MRATHASPYGGVMTIERLNYPQLPDSGITDDYHGVNVPDPYRYLEDPQDARTQEWLQAQSQLMDAERGAWSAREHFYDRVG